MDRLADAMQEAVGADPARLAAMGDRGHQRTFERHRTDVEAAKLVDLFTAATGPARRSDPPSP